jgi:uncharacterized SAM-binding protein YcdF (DUF218 family)
MYEIVVALLRPYTLLWLVLVLAVVNLWRKRRDTPGRLLLVTIPVVLLHAVSTPVVAHLALGSLEWQFPPLERRPADCQAIVVLAATVLPPDDLRDQAELADNTRLRCLYAVELYGQGPPCPILVSGDKIRPDGPGPPHARVMAAFLEKHGIPAAQVIVEDRSRTTFENAAESARELKKRGLEKVILVVDAVDMYRAAACFARQGIEVIPAPSCYLAKPYRFSVLSFVPSAGALRNCEYVWHEWLGVAWYRCRGRI